MDEGRIQVRRVFFGADIYLFSLLAVQIFLLIAFETLRIFRKAPAIPPLSEGIMSIAVTGISVLVAGLYFDYASLRYDLYGSKEDGSPRRAFSSVCGSGRHMSFPWIVSLMAFMVLLQILALQVEDLVEQMFNCFGLTTLMSPSVLTDYTVDAGMIIYSAFIGPLAEEIVFRGFILKGLMPAGRNLAILASALLFSLMHADISQLFFAFTAGLLLGYTAVEYSVGWSIALHMFNNLVLGIGLSSLYGFLPGPLADGIYVWTFAILSLWGIIALAVSLRKLPRFISEGRSGKGKLSHIWNRWFVIFLLYAVSETWLTLMPL